MTAMRIFVSYSHTDSLFCRALVHSLRAAGADVWYDEHNLESGQLMDVVQRELHSRPVFIVILTKSAFSSHWVKRETTWAYELADRDPTRIMLPVTAAPIDRTDFSGDTGWLFLSDYKRIEAPNYQPFSETEAAQRTVHALALALPGEIPAPVAPQADESADDLIARGKALSVQGKHQDALNLFRRATQLAPQSSEAWFQLGNASCTLHQYPKALAAFNRVLILKSNDAIAWNNKGIVLQNLQRCQEALAAYDHALTLDPNYIDAWIGKGNALLNLQRYQEVLAAYDHALTLNPNSVDAWANKSNALNYLERYQEALVASDHVLTLDPDSVHAWNNKGNALLNLARYQEALAAYDHALTLDPNFAHAWYNKGSTLSALQQYPEAIQSFQRYTTLAPSEANGWEQLTVCYRNLNRDAEAHAADAKAKSLQH